MSEKEIVNAKISRAFLGYEDHGILTIFLTLDYGGSGQAFGGYALDKYDGVEKKRVAHAGCGAFVAGVLRVTECDSWEKIVGKLVRVERESSYNGRVLGIGHPLKDEWFHPSSIKELY